MSNNSVPLLPRQPADDDGPVFSAPWQAKVFAMAVHLHAQGVFSWREWADSLSVHIAQFEREGGRVEGDRYYRLWQCALEALLVQKKHMAGKADS